MACAGPLQAGVKTLSQRSACDASSRSAAAAADSMNKEPVSEATTQTAAATDSTACEAAAAAADAAALPAPSEAGCPASVPVRQLDCELDIADRICICAADTMAAGLRGDYQRSSVELPDLQRSETLGLGRQGGRYVVQAGWTAVMAELGLSKGMWVTLTIRDGRVRSIQRRAGPADTAPSSSAVPEEVHNAGSPSRGAAQASTQAVVLPSATAQPGSMLLTIYRPQQLNSGQRLPTAQAQAAFKGYSKQPSDINVPTLRRKFTVSMGWACDDRFALGLGWTQLMTEVGLRHGDRVRLSRTGDASFQLDTGFHAAGMAGQDAAKDSQGAQLTGISRSGLAGGVRKWAVHEAPVGRLHDFAINFYSAVEQGFMGCR